MNAAATHCICPHCGHDLAQDAPIARGDISFDPRGEVRWRGMAVKLDTSKRIILQSLLKANGRVIPRAILGERLGSEAADVGNLVGAHIVGLRRAMPGAPIETLRGAGLRWAI